MSSKTIHSRHRYRGLKGAAKRIKLPYTQALKMLQKSGESFTQDFEESGIGYTIEKAADGFFLTVSYSDKTPACSIHFDYDFPAISPEAWAVNKAIEKFAELLESQLRKACGQELFISVNPKPGDKGGRRVDVIGVDLSTRPQVVTSIAAALAQSRAGVQVRIVSGLEPAALT